MVSLYQKVLYDHIIPKFLFLVKCRTDCNITEVLILNFWCRVFDEYFENIFEAYYPLCHTTTVGVAVERIIDNGGDFL